MAVLTAPNMKNGDDSIVVNVPAEVKAEPTRQSLRRNHSDLTLLSFSESDSSSFAGLSDASSVAGLSDACSLAGLSDACSLAGLSDSSSVVGLSDAASQSGLSVATPSSRRRRTRNKRKKQKKEPQCLVAKAVEDMNITEEEQSRYIALDCEMVGTGKKGKFSSLARVTMVDWNHNVVLDELVKPKYPVTDYRTFVSGITEDMLEGEGVLDFETCRQKVLDVLEGKILVGHGLKNDMRALKIQLPWYAVRDTAKYEPYMKARFDDGILWPQSLKTLAKNRMRREIQMPGEAHCPIEDAATAMDLYKLARRKWERAMDYKISKTRQIEQTTRQ